MGSGLAVTRPHATLSPHQLQSIKNTPPGKDYDYQKIAVDDEHDISLSTVEHVMGILGECSISLLVEQKETVPSSPDKVVVMSFQQLTVKNSVSDGTGKSPLVETVSIGQDVFFRNAEKLWQQSEAQRSTRDTVKEFIVMKQLVLFPSYNKTSQSIEFLASPNQLSTSEDPPTLHVHGYNPFADLVDEKTIHVVRNIRLISFYNPYQRDLEFTLSGLTASIQGKPSTSFSIPQKLSKAMYIPSQRAHRVPAVSVSAPTPASTNSSSTHDTPKLPSLLRKDSKTDLPNIKPPSTPRLSSTPTRIDAVNTPMSSWHNTMTNLERSTPTNFKSDVYCMDTLLTNDVIYLLMGLDYDLHINNSRMILGDSIEVLDCEGVVYSFYAFIQQSISSIPFEVEDSRRHPAVTRKMICITKKAGDAIHVLIRGLMRYISGQSCKNTLLAYKSDPTYDRVLQEEVKMGAYKFITSIPTPVDNSSVPEGKDTQTPDNKEIIHYIPSPINVVTMSLAISLFTCPTPIQMTSRLEFLSKNAHQLNILDPASDLKTSESSIQEDSDTNSDEDSSLVL